MWYIKLSSVLQTLGFSQCESDHSIFIFHDSQVTIIILAYVDDLLITGNDNTFITKLKKSFEDHFKVKDLSKNFLGLEITKTSIGLYVG